MRKLLPILVVFAMIAATATIVVASGSLPEDQPIDDPNPAYDTYGAEANIGTSAFITGGGGQGNPPIIKCKWEYDEDVELQYDPLNPNLCLEHDADPFAPHLQVKPILGQSVTVGVYAVVTDPEGVGQVAHIYADFWHPDLSFKYQIELFPVGFEGGSYNKQIALDMWDHVLTNHPDLIKYNGYSNEDIYDELWEELAYIYYGEAEISYCQPGGWYYVGVNGHDTYDNWCYYLYNSFWYIPTSAVEIDFNQVNYGSVATGINKWIGGDVDMQTPNKPTIRNIGNTPVNLYVWQNDMNFGKTAGNWNVRFDARLTGNGIPVDYYPEQSDEGYYGVRIPGTLPLCTTEKLDFSIHVYKGTPGYMYTGAMDLTAYIDQSTYIWGTPSEFHQNAPLGVPDPYNGPANPWT